MAKQLNLHSFFAQKNPSKIQVNPRDKYVVRDLMNDLISQVEKNERRKPKRKNNNENDTVMTTEKVTIWKKEFTFWNTEDGKPAPGKNSTWLEIDEVNQSFSCWICNLYPNVANKHNAVYKGCQKWHKNYPTRHCDENHKACVSLYLSEKFGKQPTITHSVKESEKRSLEKSRHELQILFRTAYFIAKEGLAFLKYEKICNLQELNGLSIGKNYLSNNACKRFIASIAADIKDETKSDFNSARFITIMSDGSTDKGIVEEEGIFVRFVKNGRPVTKFAGIENPISVDAEGLTNAILDCIKSLNNTKDKDKDKDEDEDYLKSVFQRLVNVNFDGASVMSGHVSGVQTRLKELRDGLLYTHCVAHLLELAVLDAIKFDNDYLGLFNDTLNGIFKYYYNSAVRRKELQLIADMFEEEVKKLGLLKKIRWVASRARALNLIESNYQVLVYDLEQKSYGDSETAKKALGYVKFIKQPKFLFYLFYLQDLVAVLRPLSLKFQQDELLVCEIPRLVSKAIDQIESLSVTRGQNVERLMSSLKLHPERSYDLMFKDVILDKPEGRRVEPIEHTPEGYDKYFSKACLDRIVELTSDYLTIRYNAFNETPLNEMVKLFNFKEWPLSFKDKRWGIGEMNTLTEYCLTHNWITAEEAAMCRRQWIPFRNQVSKFRKDKIIDVYSNMLLENDKDFEGINVLLDIMMTISSSTAACERGFSCMNRQKTSLRTTLSHSSLDDTMRIGIDGPEISKFNAPFHVSSWEKQSVGSRHIMGHEPPTKKKVIDVTEEN